MAEIKYHMGAFTQLRTCPEMVDEAKRLAEQLTDKANRISQVAGAEYEIGAEGIFGTKKPRIRVSIHPANIEGALDNQRHNTLLKLIGGST